MSLEEDLKFFFKERGIDANILKIGKLPTTKGEMQYKIEVYWRAEK